MLCILHEKKKIGWLRRGEMAAPNQDVLILYRIISRSPAASFFVIAAFLALFSRGWLSPAALFFSLFVPNPVQRAAGVAK